MRQRRDRETTSLLTDAVWHGRARRASTRELQRALALAQRNQVEGLLARSYPRELACVLSEVRIANQLFERNIGQVSDRLRKAGIPSVLIKAPPPGNCVDIDFDIVVRERQWEQAIGVLVGWYVHRSAYWLERAAKAHLYPQVGPALHLHAGVSWFGVPVMAADDLLTRATGESFLVPAPADQLRIWLAHAVFQNLALDLSELVAVRGLLSPEVVKDAQEEARREGWGRAFSRALATAEAAIDHLDRAVPLAFPVPLPLWLSVRAGAEHAYHQIRGGRARAAGREAALRLPLVAAKKRRLLMQ